MLGRLIGWRCETGIAKTAPAAFQPDDLLTVFQDFHLRFARFFIPGNRPQRNFDNNIFSKPSRTVIAAAGLAVLRHYNLIITQVQERPQVFAAPEDDMSAPASIAAIRPGHRVELRPHKMLAARSAMAAPA